MKLQHVLIALGLVASYRSTTQAQDPNFRFRVNFQVDTNIPGLSVPMFYPEAPWYAYFPHDPARMNFQQAPNPYPTWPAQFPQQAPNTARYQSARPMAGMESIGGPVAMPVQYQRPAPAMPGWAYQR